MRCPTYLLVVILAVLSAASALAQVPGGLPNPELQNRIPAPLPPPPQPPVINGPLSQAPPPGVYQPPRLETRQDRVARCIDDGSDAGLRGSRLDRYVRRCAK
jgi:hypothetical protein